MNYLNNDRHIPHGGVFLRIPHTCDIVYHYNKTMPYVMVLWYSFGLLLDLVGQAPKVIAEFIVRSLTDAKQKRVSPLGVLRELRILALFLQWRGGIFSRNCPSFALHLHFRADTNQLIAKSVADSTGRGGRGVSPFLTPDSGTRTDRAACWAARCRSRSFGITPSSVMHCRFRWVSRMRTVSF